MKFTSSVVGIVAAATSSLLFGTTDGAGVGTFFTYFEEGGLGPSQWQFLNMEDNQCGGTYGKSGYGQSPVTIVESVTKRCDTDMSAYSFTGGDCSWDELDYTISNNGTCVYVCFCGRKRRTYINHPTCRLF